LKKRLSVLLFLATVLFLQIFAAAQTAFADSRSYHVSGYTINAAINPDGSADMEERLTYTFDGDFNGILGDIDFSSTGGLENMQVFVEKDGSLQEWRLNSTSDLDANGGRGTYNLVREGELAKFKVFEPSSDEQKTFVLKYKFKDVVTKYNDVAEFNRKLVDANSDVMFYNIVINITLPEGAAREDIKVFGHGPLTGESKILDASHVQFTSDSNSPGNFIETLVLFPTSLVPQCTNTVAEDALPRIMANEKQLAEKANAEREEAKRAVERYQQELAARQARIDALRPIGNGLSAVLIPLWFVIIIFIYIKYDKEFKHGFEAKYYRELPGEYTPAEMSSLMSMGHVGTRDITATLMDLVRKEQLLLTTNKYVKKGIFRNKEEEDYIVSLNPNAPTVNLKEHEAFLIGWFIRGLGDGNSLVLDNISSLTQTTSGARRFKRDYDQWCSLAKGEAEKNGFFDKTCRTGIWIGVLAALAYLGLGFLVLAALQAGLGAVLILQSIILLIFSARLSRRTAYGSEQNAMWIAFRNFLKDFSHLDKAEMPAIILWEHYLVYAISLGVAKEVIRQLPLVFTDADLQDTRLTYMHGYSFANFEMFTRSFDTTVSAVENSISQAMAVANSTLSSSSGSGGGFSGGSSGGGGGGGGRGAF
jgi:uncharacterized membrane protein